MLKKNLLYTLLLSLSQFVFPLVTFPYSTRILGQAGIGSVNFIDSFTQYFVLFAALGIPVYGVREIAKSGHDRFLREKVFNEVFYLHLFSTMLCSLIYVGLALVIPRLNQHIDLVAIGILLMFFTVFAAEWFYAGIEQFAYISLRSLIIRILSVIALFLFLRPGAGPAIYYGLIVLSVALTGMSNLFYLRKHVAFRRSDLQFGRHIRPLLIILGSALAVSVYVFIDNILLGFIKGDAAVGIYATATKIAKIPFAVFVAINSVIIPKVSLAYSEGRIGDIQPLIDRSFAFICITGVPLAMGMFISANFLVKVFAGDQFKTAAGTLQILSPITLIVGFTLLLAAQLLTPMGKEKQLVKISVAGMCFSLLLNLILIPAASFYGAAITNVLTELLVCILLYLCTKKYINIVFDRSILIKCLCCSLVFIPIAAGIRQLRLSFYTTEVTIIASCAVLYAAYLLFFSKNIHIINLKVGLYHRLRPHKAVGKEGRWFLR